MSPVSDQVPRSGGMMKTMGLGGLVTGILVLVGSQVKDMITPQVTHIAVVCLLLMLAATAAGYSVSWAWTQIYKKTRVPDFRNLEPIITPEMKPQEIELERRSAREQIEHWKGLILTHAMISCLVGEGLAGVASWKLLQQLGALPPGDWLIIFIIAWGIFGALVAYSSPYVWRLIFERMFPKATGEFYAQVGADGRVGLKNATRPEDPTQYGQVRKPGPDDTQPGGREDAH